MCSGYALHEVRRVIGSRARALVRRAENSGLRSQRSCREGKEGLWTLLKTGWRFLQHRPKADERLLYLLPNDAFSCFCLAIFTYHLLLEVKAVHVYETKMYVVIEMHP